MHNGDKIIKSYLELRFFGVFLDNALMNFEYAGNIEIFENVPPPPYPRVQGK